jgi:DNA-binding transcriptional LysR family regulator
MDRIDAMAAFVAVADLEGFAPAARKLGLAPSNVTRLIAALEDRLGARLLQRTTRSVTLTDVGARYLERARRILADVEEAEISAQAERTQPSGRLVVSAPIGFGRLHVSRVMSVYLKRYPDVSGELRLSDRMINLVEDGVDLAVRIGHLADSSLVARSVGDMRRIVVASPDYLKRRGEPKKPAAVASHDTIQFGTSDWDFVEDDGEVRVPSTPRFLTNSADAAILHAEQGGGLTRVMAYQAAEAIKAGRLQIVLAKFEQPPLPIHIVYPTSRLLSAKVRTFVDLVVEVSDWKFGTRCASWRRPGIQTLGRVSGFRVRAKSAPRNDGYPFFTTRNVPLARAITAPSAFTRHCAKQSVLPVLMTSVSTVSHCPTCALLTKSMAMLTVTSETAPRNCWPQLCPIALSVSAAIKPPWTKPRALVCGLASHSPRMTASGVSFW